MVTVGSGKRKCKKQAGENGGRKGDTQDVDGLCVVAKTNAWKTVRCKYL